MLSTILFCALAAQAPAPSSTSRTADPLALDAVVLQPSVRFAVPSAGASLPYGPVRVVIEAQPGSDATLLRGSLSGAVVAGAQWTYPTPDGGPKVLELTTLDAGTHTLRVTVTDSRGRPAQASVTFAVRAAGTDRTPPVLAITAPAADPLVVQPGTPLTFSGTAGDDVALRSVTWQLSGPVSGDGALSALGTWSTTLASLRAGNYTFSVTARDRSGKQTVRRRQFTVAADAGAPPPRMEPDQGGDIVSCGSGSGLSALLLLLAPLVALRGRRCIE